MLTEQDDKLNAILEALDPVALPPADYPPAVIVRESDRDELMARIAENAKTTGIDLSDEHYEVINFLFDFYSNCCAADDPGFINPLHYWKKVDKMQRKDNGNTTAHDSTDTCPYGQLSSREALDALRVYRVLTKAFKDKGGKKHLYRLFPYGPIFTIHLLAQLPRLLHDVDTHYGTAF